MDIKKYQEKICRSLRAEQIYNDRIGKRILSNKKKNSIKSYCSGLIKRKNSILELLDHAKIIGIEMIDTAYILQNIDVIDTKNVLDRIKAKLPFGGARNTSIIKLAKGNVPRHILQSLVNANSTDEFDAIIQTLPPILLVNLGILKTNKEDNYFTKQSIKPISTPMRD